MLRSREQAGDALGVAESLNNIGFAQFQLGDYDSANVFWQQALAAFQKLDDPNGLAQARQNIGALEIARGHWKQARQLLESSLASAQAHQMVEETAVSKFYLGELSLLEGRMGDALQFAGSAHSLFSERKDQRGIIDASWLEARILFAANATARLAKRDQELSALLKDASDEQKAAAALLHVQMAQRRGDGEAERASLAQARSFAEASGIQMLKLRVAILATPGNPALREQAARLGNLPVRLEELEQALRVQLSGGQLAESADTYREALLALDKHDQAFAGLALHGLGAQLLQRTGDQAGKAAALSRARAAAQHVLAGLPADMRGQFESLPQVQAVLGTNNGK
jgi:tetratricopeptide (TPR) repeat protein